MDLTILLPLLSILFAAVTNSAPLSLVIGTHELRFDLSNLRFDLSNIAGISLDHTHDQTIVHPHHEPAEPVHAAPEVTPIVIALNIASDVLTSQLNGPDPRIDDVHPKIDHSQPKADKECRPGYLAWAWAWSWIKTLLFYSSTTLAGLIVLGIIGHVIADLTKPKQCSCYLKGLSDGAIAERARLVAEAQGMGGSHPETHNLDEKVPHPMCSTCCDE